MKISCFETAKKLRIFFSKYTCTVFLFKCEFLLIIISIFMSVDCNMERSYQTSVSDLKLNGCYSAALCDKRIELHEITGVKVREKE